MTPALLVVALLALQGAPPVLPAPPSTDALGRAYYLFLQGLTQEGENDFAGAIDSYRQAIELLPGAAIIHLELASLYARQNQIADARREARAAVNADPDSREAHRLLGGIEASAIEGQPPGPSDAAVVQTAVDHLERALAGQAPDAPAELLLSSLYVRQGQTAKAVERLTKVLAERPNYPPALRLLVRTYEAAGRGAEASTALALLARVPPDGVETLVRQADRLERAGRWAEAAERWSEIIESDPGGAIYRTRQAAALANSGRLQDARAVLGVATRDLPRSIGAWYLVAIIEARAGDAAAADEAAKRVAEIDPTDGRGPLAAARARSAAGDHRGVVEILGGRVARPTAADVGSGLFVEMAGDLSAAHGRLGQRGRAADVLEGARKHAPDDQALLFSLGAAYEEDRRYDHAERSLRELIRLNAAHGPALNYLGYMLAERGEKLPEAVDLVTRALAIDKDNPAYLDSLGWAYFRLGQLENARQPLERAASALPKVSVIQDHLGDLYVQMKRYTDAVAAFDRALGGDRDGIDAAAVARKRDRARGLAGTS